MNPDNPPSQPLPPPLALALVNPPRRSVHALRPRRKPKGGVPSEMTRLQILWDKTLSDEQKDWLRDQIHSQATLPAIREHLLKELQVHLKYDTELVRFREFVRRRDESAEAAALLADEESTFLEQCPDWTLDQVREEVLRLVYARVCAAGDADLALQILRVHTAFNRYQLDREKQDCTASQQCYDDLPGLQAIRNDPGLTLQEKLRQIRLKLFGRIAEEQPQPQPQNHPAPTHS